jgi:hypothetical protein
MDRKVRRTLAIVGVMLLLVVALAVRSYISRVTDEDTLATPMDQASDERLVVIDGDTMLVEPEGLGQSIVAWLQSQKGKTLSFELSEKSFQPNSPAPSPITETRIGQVAGVAKTSPTLRIHILEPEQFESLAAQRLDEQRALRLRNELVASGVNQSHVTVEHERKGLPTAKSPNLAVLLTK